MATHPIKVEGGKAFPVRETVQVGDDILWNPGTPATTVDIDFGGNSPVEWKQKKETPGKTVKGTVQKSAAGGRFPYGVGNSMGTLEQGMPVETGPEIISGPEIIVDSGLRKTVPRATSAKSTKSTKSAKSTKKTKKTKSTKSRKSTRSTKRTKPAKRTKRAKR